MPVPSHVRSTDGTVLWDAPAGVDMATVVLVRLAPDGATLLIADEVPYGYRGGRILLLRGSECRSLLERDEFRQPGCMSFSADGRWLLVGLRGQHAQWAVWSLDDGECRSRREAPYAQRLGLQKDRTNAALVDEELDALDEVFVDHGPVMGAIRGDGSIVAGASRPTGDSAVLDERALHRGVYVWREGETSPTIFEASEAVCALAFADVAPELAVATASGGLERWDLDSARCIAHDPPPGPGVPRMLEALPGGRFMLGFEDGRLYEVGADGRFEERWRGRALLDLAVREDGTVILAELEERITVVEPGIGPIRTIDPPQDFERWGAVSLSPDGERLLVATPSQVRSFSCRHG